MSARRSPEVRARMSAARKKALQDPEVRARISAASKKALQDPEVRARMSAARKRRRDHMAAIGARARRDVLAALGAGKSTKSKICADTGWPLPTIAAAMRDLAAAGKVIGSGRPKVWWLVGERS